MALIVMPNNVEADGPVTPPAHADGSTFRYCMYFHNGFDVAFADTYGELLQVLLPGYENLDEVGRAEQRILLGVAAANQVQAAVIAEADLSAVSDEDYRTLTAPRIAPAVRADWWSCPVPLVVVETAYEPWSDVPRPASALSDTQDAPNLWWIRPGDEEEFLLSLHDVGYVRLLEAAAA